ncbi:LEAF RUST 10 DISEASE-RESISTANCE LOCUS RECEPTOR-LIKE PROTEIN KINASE-like 1.2 [Neltuma alba]|uniref:LEAF RUST 10 DISEASE-RESISTANCE LOCUS RECEPTOR-LIKE PROTEIN KINASE-like 1.2 n=1 Tax=Neltuma alba TaxID=207710 RepID=UPI0010A41D5D|nr:LEAF RUST 10 DISEASE-RESISTANCE LOCUS RECEPTOR-LIKE PROTEIN KINASE-like 1.2 [Prosopis alba]
MVSSFSQTGRLTSAALWFSLLILQSQSNYLLLPSSAAPIHSVVSLFRFWSFFFYTQTSSWIIGHVCSRFNVLLSGMLAQKKNDSSQKLSHSETTIDAAYLENDVLGMTSTPTVPRPMPDKISPASLIKHDTEMAEKLEVVTDRPESILGLRESTVWGNCSHLKDRVASFMKAPIAAKLVVVGGALVSLIAVLLRRIIIRPQFRVYLGIRRPNINNSPLEGDINSIEEAINIDRVIQEDDSAVNSVSRTTNLSPWERVERIGAGGYGIVYVARHRETGAFCAVKELNDIHKLPKVESFKRIGRHIFLYMEYIQPGSLKKYISERGGLLEPLIQNFTAQILSGLDYLCNERVVHRDIKPDNLLVDSNNIVKLVDFGVAKHD